MLLTFYMIISQKIFFLISLLFVSRLGQAQEFGGNPPSLKWKQINTSASKVIFPKGLDSQASRVANVISYLNSTTQQTIGSRQRKINVVLQNQTTISNA